MLMLNVICWEGSIAGLESLVSCYWRSFFYGVITGRGMWDVRMRAFFSAVLHVFVLPCFHVCVLVHVGYQILSLFAY